MSKKRTKRQQAILRRNLFLVCCAAVMVAIIAVIVLIVSSVKKSNVKPEKKKSETYNSQSDVKKEEKPLTYSEEPEPVTIGSFSLDANYTRLLLVNGENPLPEDYNYEKNLITLKSSEYRGGNNQVDKGMYPYLQAMLEAAKRDGVDLFVWSPYRSFSDQKMVFEREVKKHTSAGLSEEEAETEALKMVTRPGTSEHHTGLCCDLNMADDAFTGTAAHNWLLSNAEKFGFILRYPENKTDITKVEYESWHWRFVGINRAKEINSLGLTLEEFCEKAKVDRQKELMKSQGE